MRNKSGAKTRKMQGGGWGSARIRAELAKRGVTSTAIAKQLEVSKVAVSAAINDAQSWAICEFVAKFLGHPIDEIWPQIMERSRRGSSAAGIRGIAEASK